MGLSAHPDAGYTKKNQARDIAGVMDALKIQTADLVTHDIGNMVGYALAAQYPGAHHQMGGDRRAAAGNRQSGTRSSKARCSGISTSAVRMRSGWWPDGNAFISIASITNYPPTRRKIDEATRQHYAALYARPHAMHDAFEQFGAFNQDAIDNQEMLANNGKLTMPVLALGAEKSFGAGASRNLRLVATNVTAGSCRIPVTGSWRRTRKRPSISSSTFWENSGRFTKNRKGSTKI